MRTVAFIAATAVATVLFIGLLYVVRGQVPPLTALASLTATATPTATATATPTPVASTSTPTSSPTALPTPTGLYVNPTYRFSLVLPPPYRQSTPAIIGTVSPQRDQFAFTARTEADEASIDTSGCHTACPLWQAAAYVIVSPGTGTQTPREYYAKEVGSSTSEKIEDTTVDGRPAIRVTTGAVYATAFVIKDGDRTFLVGYRLYGPENGMAIPAGASKEKLDAILASFKFVP